MLRIITRIHVDNLYTSKHAITYNIHIIIGTGNKKLKNVLQHWKIK